MQLSSISPSTLILAAISLLSWSPTASATVYNLTPAHNWFGILSNNRLQPGDEVILAGGVYSDNRKLKMWQQGTAEKPIVIRSADGERAVITRPNANQNVINIEGGQYLTLRGIEVTGGSAGIRLGGGLSGQPNSGDHSKFVTIEDSIIHDVGDTAISANNSGQRYEGMVFRNNEIYNTNDSGEAFYLGCNNNGCQFFDGLIEGNYIHDLKSSTVSQGDGIEIKHGSYNNIIRDNVIHDTNFPGIIAYGTAGNGDPNIIERNVIWNSNNQGIQVAADAIIRNNIVFNNGAENFRSQNHQGAKPGNLTIVNNTFITNGGDAIRVANTVTAPILIANNAIYARTREAIQVPISNNITISGNVGIGNTIPGLPEATFDSSGNLVADFTNVAWTGPGRDAFPIVGSALVGAGDPTYMAADDFNGTPRTSTRDVGAYIFNANGNPGWTVTSGFKFLHVDHLDCNGDGVWDVLDLPCVTSVEERDILLAVLNTLPGDLDGNGMVDFGDFLGLSSSFGTAEVRYDLGNIDLINGVDFNDFLILSSNFGLVLGPTAAAVPEPSSLALLALGALLLGLVRRRGR